MPHTAQRLYRDLLNGGLFLIALLTLGSTFYQRITSEQGRKFILPATASEHAPAFFRSSFIDPKPSVPSVHAAAATPVKGGILAVWYGGSREGAKDVQLFQARYHHSAQQNNPSGWQVPRSILNRQQAMNQLGIYIRKIGNPVLHRAPDGRVWLFFVTVSHGGWAGSQLNVMISEDEGAHWQPAKRLVTSPFLNISTLVKGKPVDLSQGMIGVPIYHEFITKYGAFMRIDSHAQVRHKSKLALQYGAIQPSVIPASEHEAVAFLRGSGTPENKVYRAHSNNAGTRWHDITATELNNPDAAVSTLKLDEDKLLIAYNDSNTHRKSLTLAVSHHDQAWQRLAHLEDATVAPQTRQKQEFSYPLLLRDDAGHIHLLYTWHRSHIKHAVFNQRWLSTQPKYRANTP